MFKYFKTTVTNQNYIDEKINKRLKWGMVIAIKFKIIYRTVSYLKTRR
jgi:hypothetical protein